jgi:uncharacterized membrane protein YphA (DoxX/SURF4 family)
VEIFCGALLIIGVFTRLAALPLLAVILTAIGTTKIPELFHVNQGVWFMLHDARTDISMLLGLIFLLIVGPGPLSISGARQGIIDYRTEKDREDADETPGPRFKQL